MEKGPGKIVLDEVIYASPYRDSTSFVKSKLDFWNDLEISPAQNGRNIFLLVLKRDRNLDSGLTEQGKAVHLYAWVEKASANYTNYPLFGRKLQ